MPNFIPDGIPVALANQIQTNMLARDILDSLGVASSYWMDAAPKKLAPGTGINQTFMRLGRMDADLRPAPPVGATPRGEYATEFFTANPKPYARTLDWDAPTAYALTSDDLGDQKTRVLADWAGRTKGRIARSALFRYCGGQTVIRRAQTTAENVLLVDSLAGFRFVHINGAPVPVSATTPLPVTIVAGTTFTALVTGVTPLDPDFPSGPGQLTLLVNLQATVVANSFVHVTGARPKIVRPNGKVSTEALTASDIPTLTDILTMKARLVDRGVAPHANTGTYHLHVDAWFFVMIQQDPAWRQSFQGQGLSPIFGAKSIFVPGLGLTVIESNDAPSLGKGAVVSVGGSPATSVGANGTPGASLTMLDNGIPVVTSTGVQIRRAILTGGEVMYESYVDEEEYLRLIGGKVIHQITNIFSVVSIGNVQYVAGSLARWRLLIRPPLDERALVPTITVSATFDMVLGTDTDTISDSLDKSPLKRAVVCEYGSPAY